MACVRALNRSWGTSSRAHHIVLRSRLVYYYFEDHGPFAFLYIVRLYDDVAVKAKKGN